MLDGGGGVVRAGELDVSWVGWGGGGVCDLWGFCFFFLGNNYGGDFLFGKVVKDDGLGGGHVVCGDVVAELGDEVYGVYGVFYGVAFPDSVFYSFKIGVEPCLLYVFPKEGPVGMEWSGGFVYLKMEMGGGGGAGFSAFSDDLS